MFTSFLFEPSSGVVDLGQKTVNALGSWDNGVTVTTADDIGALTMEIVFAQPRVVDQIVYIAGDTITYRQLADTVDELLDLNVSRSEWSEPELKRALAEDPDNSIKKYRAVFAEGKGVAWDKSQTFNAQRGIKACGLEDWMRANLLANERVALADVGYR